MMYASHSFLELITFLLPGAPDLRCDALDLDLIASTMTLAVTSTQAHSACPRCQQSATRIHSHYQRTVADLPWAASTVRLHLRVRRFFCSSNDCSQRIFTERVPTVVMPWARRTQRLADRQRAVGLALGGAAGARLTAHLDQLTSRDTVLRLVRQLPEPDEVTPRHLGVDDFALRKAHSYGTILVNLDTGSAIDLLLNRSADVLASWLRAHPGVELITRDQAGAYAEGARHGAPDAVQIADRWHVLNNLADALKQIFADYPQALTPAPAKPQEQAKVGAEVVDSPDAPKVAPSQAALPPATLPLPCTRPEQRRQQCQARREVRYAQVQALVAQGVSLRTIATQLHLSRGTVRKYARSAAAPVAQPRAKGSSLLDPYKPYLVERWNAGCHVGAELVRQIQAHGYQGGRSIAMDFVAAIRKQHGVAPMKRTGLPPQTAIDPSLRAATPRELTWVVLKRPAQRDAEEQAQLLHVQQAEPKLAVAITLAQEFAVMVRERDHERLDSWLKQAESSGLRALKSFAGGIRRDYAAVRAGLRVVYSNGVVEGNVNRLKYLKRQMVRRVTHDGIAPARSLD